jgi:DNA-binding MarR family transcriptional regulator
MKAAFGIGDFDHALLIAPLQSPRRQARMSDLAWILWLAPSNITHRVGRLEKRGLVVRRADPDDGRVVLARITPKGVRLLREAHSLVDDGRTAAFPAPHRSNVARVGGRDICGQRRLKKRPGKERLDSSYGRPVCGLVGRKLAPN